ncbi:hypothetical protein [Amycolatopsis sp. CA-230715]|uniref:hypothetical protein n=1 Tax=Amycolatopsis sp. CA-230715 TaxID=2745196 RepID=UPI001C019842|nr:hypothetical protein [Amycolatopsis sp. CA-230715]QWF77555.1 hypothetical protein HUW46_00947 [Amycolatopsis sp. CA-230715]
MATRLARFVVVALLGLLVAGALHAESGSAAPFALDGHSASEAQSAITGNPVAAGDSCPEHGHRGEHEPSEHIAAGVVPIPLRDSGPASVAPVPDGPGPAIQPARAVSVRAPAFRPPGRHLLVDLCVFRI